LRELARTANARIYIGFEKHSLSATFANRSE
jgi:hypothetical protein